MDPAGAQIQRLDQEDLARCWQQDHVGRCSRAPADRVDEYNITVVARGFKLRTLYDVACEKFAALLSLAAGRLGRC